METILNELLSFLLLYKYIGLFLASFLAAFALPIPSSSMLAAAGAFAATGYFSLMPVLLTALIGNMLGDLTAYLIGRQYGEKIFTVIGLKKVVTSSLYTKVSDLLRDFSYSFIFFSRFITTVGPLVSFLSGLSKISYTTFL